MYLVRDGVLTLFPFSGHSCKLFVLDLVLDSWRKVEIELESSKIWIQQYHAADYWEEEEMILVNTAKPTISRNDCRTYAVYLLKGEIRLIQSKGLWPSTRSFH